MFGFYNPWLFGLSMSLAALAAASFAIVAQQAPRRGEGASADASRWDIAGALSIAWAIAAWQAVGKGVPLQLAAPQSLRLLLGGAALFVALLLALRFHRRGDIAGRVGAALLLLGAALALPLAVHLERLTVGADLAPSWLAAAAALPLAFAAVALLPHQRGRALPNAVSAALLFAAFLALQAVGSWPPLQPGAMGLAPNAPLGEVAQAVGVALTLAALALLLLAHRWSSARHARRRELRLARVEHRQRLLAGDSARLLRENALRANEDEQCAQMLLAGANVGSFDWDLVSGSVRYGGAWAAMLGYDAAQLEAYRDTWMQRCHPDDLPQLQRRIEEHLASGRHPLVCELRMKTARRTWHWVRVQAEGVEHDAEGRPRRLVGTQVDIDEHKRVQQAADLDGALFGAGPVRRIAFEAAAPQRLRHGSCALPLPVPPSADHDDAGGDDAPLAAAGQALADWVHGEDLPAFGAAAARAAAAPGRPLHCELRLADAAGGWRRVVLHALVDRHAADESERGLLRGYLVDIERLKQADTQADTHGDDLERLVVKMSSTQRFLEVLQEMAEQLQLCESVAAGCELIARAGPALFPGWSGALAFIGADGLLALTARWGEAGPVASSRLGGADCWAVRLGRLHHASADAEGRSLAPVCGHLGGGNVLPEGVTHTLCAPLSLGKEPAGALQLAIREPLPDDALRQAIWGAETLAHTLRLSLANLNLRVSLREQAVRDWMTGLFNRRHFDEVLQQELRRAARGGDNVVLALFDIDHFKSFNDAYGHEAGDEVIRAVGRQLQAFVRSYDVAARIGGEELAVLLPRAHLEETCARLDGLRERIADLALSYDGVVLPAITVSIGVADIEHGPAGSLLQRADTAMYASKHNGRNQLTCWNPSLPTVSELALLDEARETQTTEAPAA